MQDGPDLRSEAETPTSNGQAVPVFTPTPKDRSNAGDNINEQEREYNTTRPTRDELKPELVGLDLLPSRKPLRSILKNASCTPVGDESQGVSSPLPTLSTLSSLSNTGQNLRAVQNSELTYEIGQESLCSSTPSSGSVLIVQDPENSSRRISDSDSQGLPILRSRTRSRSRSQSRSRSHRHLRRVRFALPDGRLRQPQHHRHRHRHSSHHPSDQDLKSSPALSRASVTGEDTRSGWSVLARVVSSFFRLSSLQAPGHGTGSASANGEDFRGRSRSGDLRTRT